MYWVTFLSAATIVGAIKLLRRSRQQDRAERHERVPLDLDRNFMREMAEVAKHIESLYHRPKEDRE